MRIAHVTATFPPYMSGTGNVCYNNARELVRRGHEVHVYTASGENAHTEEVVEGVYVHRLKPLFRFGNAPFMPSIINLKEFDIIHLHFPFFGGEFSSFAARIRKIPLIVTYHQDVLLHGVLGLVEKLMRYSINRWLLNSADQLLFTSLDYSNASYFFPLLKNKRASIGELPNGTDPNHFAVGDLNSSFIDQFRSSEKEKNILVVAGLDDAHYFKGIHILIQALPNLPETVRAVIVGEGNMRRYYENLATSTGIQNRVFFPGRVPYDQLPRYYQLADVTVLPSTTMGEAFGLVLVESLACETPVIASNLPGVRTVVDDGEDGYLVIPGNVDDLTKKINKILDLPEADRKAMGKRGRAKVIEKYTWERAGERLEEIYNQAIARKQQ
jgi:glycosyltransferase involved in cell wall biosynthesis